MSKPETVAGLGRQELASFVSAVLAEDLGTGGDVTTNLTIGDGLRLSAVIATRQDIVVAGLELGVAFFRQLDPGIKIELLKSDGERAARGDVLMRLEGNGRAMLSAERSALNSLQHLSGIATLTHEYADKIAGTGCTLLDTRKTIPGLRVIEKYAAHMGGATNHRMRLDDGVLIKDNHIALCGGVERAVGLAKASELEIQVEVDLLEQIEPALAAGAERLLCDNMSAAMLREAVKIVGGRVPIEASGGVRLDTIRDIAETGVDFVSVGRITQSAPAADIGLDYSPA